MTSTTAVSGKILIIDDDEKLNRLLTDYLSKMGFTVLTATLPSAGLEKQEEETPDLVILDVMLPGKSGYDILREIRLTPECLEIPVLMLTARGQTKDRQMAEALGASRFMTKPFSNQEMLDAVRELAGA